MRLSDFVLLSEERKKDAILHEGMLVAKRRQATEVVFLFQLDNFYVEMYGNAQTKQVDGYKFFDSVELLEPYLESIPINGLFES